MAMHAVWWVANVSACSAWATNSATSEKPRPAVSAIRSAMAAPHTTSQRDIGRRPMKRPWARNQAISTATETAQSVPIMAL